MRLSLFGDGGIGKRSLIETWNNVIVEVYDPTLEDGPTRKLVSVGRQRFMVEWWECPYGRPNYEHQALFRQILRNTDGYALAYSAGSRRSFESARAWKETIASLSGSQGCPSECLPVLGALIETKSDLVTEPPQRYTCLDETVKKRQVQASEGEQLARELGCPFFQTSSKTRYNIDEAFDSVARTCKRAMAQAETENTVPNPASSFRDVEEKDLLERRSRSFRGRLKSIWKRLGVSKNAT